MQPLFFHLFQEKYLGKISWVYYDRNHTLLKSLKNIYIAPFGGQGLVLGMILGLIPCGIVLWNDDICDCQCLIIHYSWCVDVLYFSFSTMPGLFIVAYSGQEVITRFKSFARTIYSTMMVVNGTITI